jgi:oxygen-independent coproporphyrinogen-3 oxidase
MDLRTIPTDNFSKAAGLYIHIPFCVKKCSYCAFYSISSIALVPDFLAGLFKEMEITSHKFGPFDTVYIGGGTPSILRPHQLREILKGIRNHFDLQSGAEITIEANPGDLDKPFLRELAAMGFNRLNVGIQSFDGEVLQFLGRRHSVKEALLAIERSRGAGFHNLGLDLIYGIPGQGIESWLESLARAVDFAPEHLSCYQLSIEKNTPLKRELERGKFSIPGEDLQYDFFIRTAEFLENSGYLHYEVSNFAKGIKYLSRHNQKYWDHTPYLGLGPSAHSFLGDQRWWNDPTLHQYLAAIQEGRLPIKASEILTPEQLRLEAIYLGLRTQKGVNLKDLLENHKYDLLSEKKELLTKLRQEGFLGIEDDRLYPTRAGLAVADTLALI